MVAQCSQLLSWILQAEPIFHQLLQDVLATHSSSKDLLTKSLQGMTFRRGSNRESSKRPSALGAGFVCLGFDGFGYRASSQTSPVPNKS